MNFLGIRSSDNKINLAVWHQGDGGVGRHAQVAEVGRPILHHITKHPVTENVLPLRSSAPRALLSAWCVGL
jgi:hypothetical protein